MLRTLIACILLSSSIACAKADTLRIGLISQFRGIDSVSVKSSAGLCVTYSGSKLVTCIDPGRELKISRTSDTLEFSESDGGTNQADLLHISSDTPGAVITVSSGKTKDSFRGAIEITPSAKGLLLVNQVDLEEYMLGVVACEMPSEFDVEALKAQAVAARTYAWANRNKHRKEGFDLCDSTHCQMYSGVDRETERTTKAVRDTKDLVALHHGKLICALYSADCGGITESGDKPYLCSVSDKPDDDGPDYCDRSGHAWTLTWTLSELEALLEPRLPKLQGLKSITVSKADECGRAVEVKIEADKGSVRLSGQKLRSVIGVNVLLSTAFTIKKDGEKVTVDGRGYGHGIGLCQFGANGLAKSDQGYSFERILKHYYHDIEIKPLSSSQLTDTD